MKTEEEVQANLKFPKSLKDKLKAAAKENHRSMTAEVVARLESTFEEGSLYGHKLPPEMLALGANDLDDLVDSVNGAIHTLLRAGEVLHIARNQAQGVERAEDKAAEQQAEAKAAEQRGEDGEGITDC